MIVDGSTPKFAGAQQIPKDDPRLKAENVEYASPQGYGKMEGLVRPAKAAGKLPGVLVVHENRGLNPHIEDIARRVALDNYVAFAPDALTPLGGYPAAGEDDAASSSASSSSPRPARTWWRQPGSCARTPNATAARRGGLLLRRRHLQLPGNAGARAGGSVPFYGGPAAAEEVPKIKARMLIHYAGTDERINAAWPAYEAALKAAGVKYAMHMYPGTQHGFNNDTTPRYDKAAAAEAWKRTMAPSRHPAPLVPPGEPMSTRLNALGQPVGPPLPDWQAPPRPTASVLDGTWTRLEGLDPDRHARAALRGQRARHRGPNWTYLPIGPFADLRGLRRLAATMAAGRGPVVLRDHRPRDGLPVGVASYLRIDPAAGSIEVGHINFSPLAQRTSAATEAMFLMMRQAFALGYRRYEWKCDALNAPSRAAAERLGFTYEGMFRQATIYKGRNRDTAWYSILDREFPALERAFLHGWRPTTATPAAGSVRRLSDLIAAARQS